MEKLEIFEELKKNMCKQLLIESRIARGLSSNNYTQKDDIQIPLDIQKRIDDVYRVLNDIAVKYRVSTSKVEGLIKDGRFETKDVASRGYKNKIEEQFQKINTMLREMENELNENGKIDERKNSSELEERMNSIGENREVREDIVRNLNEKVRRIRYEIQQTFNEKFFDPRRLKQMDEEVEINLRRLETGDKIEEALVNEDRYIARRIISEFQEYANSINKTRHQKFEEECKVEVPELHISLDDNTEERVKQNEKTQEQQKSSMGDALPYDVIR